MKAKPRCVGLTSNGLPGTDWTAVTKRPVEVEAKRVEERRKIDTREGTVVADPGDVLMRGVEGELYPCDPDIFRKTYRLGGAGEDKTIQQVYEDRNALALALAEAARYLSLERPESHQFGVSWTPDDGDDADADEWAILYVKLPRGQVSWHVPRKLVEASNLPRRNTEWDGHDRDEKNARLRAFAGLSDAVKL